MRQDRYSKGTGSLAIVALTLLLAVSACSIKLNLSKFVRKGKSSVVSVTLQGGDVEWHEMDVGFDLEADVQTDIPGYIVLGDACDAADFFDTLDFPDAGDVGDAQCLPDCEARECGPDGCGGSCGACPTDAFCSTDGICTPTGCQVDEDCPGVLLCDVGSGDCVQCLTDGDCPDQAWCDQGSCQASFCVPGETVCLGKQVALCDEQGSGWASFEECPDGTTCSSGLCEAMLCEPGSSFCLGSFSLATCHDSGKSMSAQLCPVYMLCQYGACVNWLCAPGSKYCSGNIATACSSDGTYKLSEENCTQSNATCVSGVCIPAACDPEVTVCSNWLELGVCNDPAQGIEAVPCPVGQVCEDGECKDHVCGPNKKMCVGQTAMLCNSEGTSFIAELDCEAMGQVCSNGECVDVTCEPNGTFCQDEHTLVTCGPQGLPVDYEDCTPATCLAGQCALQDCEPFKKLCVGSFAVYCSPNEYSVFGHLDCSLQGKQCVDGHCEDCTPECSQVECGDNGCGGSCGNCDDGDVCSLDYCEQGSCHHVLKAVCCKWEWQCDDGDPCTQDLCLATTCVSLPGGCDPECSEDADCADGNQCTIDYCIGGNCLYEEVADCCQKDADCDNNDPCTVDACVSGTCAHTPDQACCKSAADCEDQDPCTTDKCLAGTCFNQPVPQCCWTFADCDDGNGCTEDTCVDMTCSHTYTCCDTHAQCDDQGGCTFDYCASKCVNAPVLEDGCCPHNLLWSSFEPGTDPHWTWDKSGWTVTGSPVVSGAVSLARKHPAPSSSALVTQVYSPVVDVPSTGATLTFSVMHQGNYDCQDETGWRFEARVNAVVVYTFCQEPDLWHEVSVDVSEYAGMPVQVTFAVVHDEPWHASVKEQTFRLDDVTLTSPCCQTDTDCDDANPCTEDSCGPEPGCRHEPLQGCCSGEPDLFADFELGLPPDWKGEAKDDKLAWQLTSEDAWSGLRSVACKGGSWPSTPPSLLRLPTYQVPASGAELAFRFKQHPATDCAGTAGPGLTVSVNGIVAPKICAPEDTWTDQVLDLSAWAGQTVEIEFSGMLAGFGNGKFLLDDVRLAPFCCNLGDPCDDGTGCTVDSCAPGGSCLHETIAECCPEEPLFQLGFDAGSPGNWTIEDGDETHGWRLAAEQAHSGANGLLAGSHNAPDLAPAVLRLPELLLPIAGGTLTFWLKQNHQFDCGTKTGKRMQVEVNGIPVYVACAPVDKWTKVTVDLSPWTGIPIDIAFVSIFGDSMSWVQFVIDDITVEAPCCLSADDCDDQDLCTLDTCTPGQGCAHTPEPACCSAKPLLSVPFEEGGEGGWSVTDAMPVLGWQLEAESARSGELGLRASSYNAGDIPRSVLHLPLLTIPETGATLSFWLKQNSAVECDATAGKRIEVTVNGLVLYISCAPVDQWTEVSLDLSDWAGMQVALAFESVFGNSTQWVVFSIDDIVVSPHCCQADPDCADGDDCTVDVCSPQGGCLHEPAEDCCAPASGFALDFELGLPPGSAQTGYASGDGWKSSPEGAHTGQNGLLVSADLNEYAFVSFALPPLAVPGAGATLSFWQKQSFEAECDEVGVASGGVFINGLRAYAACAPVDEWSEVTIDLLPWVGQSILVQFNAHFTAPQTAMSLAIDDVTFTPGCQ